MPNYKKMYLHLMRETEKALRILIAAQQTCEELYLQEQDTAQDASSAAVRESAPLPKAE